MKTTVGFYLGEVKKDHLHLQVYPFKDGYAVEEKGVSFLDIGEFKALQQKRFERDETLLRIDIHEPGVTPVTILRS